MWSGLASLLTPTMLQRHKDTSFLPRNTKKSHALWCVVWCGGGGGGGGGGVCVCVCVCMCVCMRVSVSQSVCQDTMFHRTSAKSAISRRRGSTCTEQLSQFIGRISRFMGNSLPPPLHPSRARCEHRPARRALAVFRSLNKHFQIS